MCDLIGTKREEIIDKNAELRLKLREIRQKLYILRKEVEKTNTDGGQDAD